MKIRISISYLGTVALILLFTFAAAAGAQDNISKPQEPEVKAVASVSGFRVLYRFCVDIYCTDHDGFNPAAGLIQDAAGQPVRHHNPGRMPRGGWPVRRWHDLRGGQHGWG